jgi:hypothetical protein
MAIRSVSRDEFDKFKPARSPILEMTIEEVEWFADDGGIVIGVLARDRADDDWSAAILGRDERGQFRAIDMAVSVKTRDEARTLLNAKMEKALATGETVFPQGD